MYCRCYEVAAGSCSTRVGYAGQTAVRRRQRRRRRRRRLRGSDLSAARRTIMRDVRCEYGRLHAHGRPHAQERATDARTHTRARCRCARAQWPLVFRRWGAVRGGGVGGRTNGGGGGCRGSGGNAAAAVGERAHTRTTRTHTRDGARARSTASTDSASYARPTRQPFPATRPCLPPPRQPTVIAAGRRSFYNNTAHCRTLHTRSAAVGRDVFFPRHAYLCMQVNYNIIIYLGIGIILQVYDYTVVAMTSPPFIIKANTYRYK